MFFGLTTSPLSLSLSVTQLLSSYYLQPCCRHSFLKDVRERKEGGKEGGRGGGEEKGTGGRRKKGVVK